MDARRMVNVVENRRIYGKMWRKKKPMKAIIIFIAAMFAVGSGYAAETGRGGMGKRGSEWVGQISGAEAAEDLRRQRMREIEKEQKTEALKLRIQGMQKRGKAVKAIVCYKAWLKYEDRWSVPYAMQMRPPRILISLRFGNHTDYNAKAIVYTIKLVDALGEELYRTQVKDFRPLESWHVGWRQEKYIEDPTVIEKLKNPVENKAVKVLIRLEKVLWENGQTTILFTPPKLEKK